MSDTITRPRRRRRPRLAPACLRRADLARYLGISVSALDRMNAGQLLPEPIRLGCALLWRRREILAWLAADAPDRDSWESIRVSREGAAR